MSSPLVEKSAQHVEMRLNHDLSGHDWFHTYRVWQLARYLQSKEGGDSETIEVAALLHCAAEHDLRSMQNERLRSYTLMGILDVLEIDGVLRENIIAIAQWCHYKGRDTQRPTTLEGKIVQDANFLETMGAIGIARAFTAGGYLGRSIHDPAASPLPFTSGETYQRRKREGTSINYIYEKPLQLMAFLNTNEAKRLAEKRIAFTKLFLDEFHREWKLEDV